MKQKYIMLACPHIKNEIEQIMCKYNLDYEVIFLPETLHQSPDNLREYLDNFLSKLTDVENVILPMGRCGNGTVGIHSYNSNLILPKSEDCIDLLLSKDKLMDVHRAERTYFLTEGWLEGTKSIMDEYNYTLKRFNKEIANEVLQMIYSNYKQFGYIDTENSESKFIEAAKKISPLAQCVNMKITKLNGPCGVLKKMVCCQFDSDDVIFVPPHTEVTENLWYK